MPGPACRSFFALIWRGGMVGLNEFQPNIRKVSTVFTLKPSVGTKITAKYQKNVGLVKLFTKKPSLVKRCHRARTPMTANVVRAMGAVQQSIANLSRKVRVSATLRNLLGVLFAAFHSTCAKGAARSNHSRYLF
jgi:hypothetical protein